MSTPQSITTIDFGRTSHKASHYQEHKELLQQLLSGDPVESGQDATATPTAAVPAVTQPADSAPASDSTSTALQMLGLTPKEETVEFVFPIPDTSDLRLKIQTLAVAKNDDSISILIPSTIELFPPKLAEFTIKLSSVQYPVIYAGGVLRLGSIQMLSFVRTQ